MNADWLVGATSSNKEAFQRWYCPNAVAYNFDCYRFQPVEYEDSDSVTADIDGNPRFDASGDTATKNAIAYFYDHANTGTSGAISSETIANFTGAASLAASLTASIILFMSF